jgi:hypothetical protein
LLSLDATATHPAVELLTYVEEDLLRELSTKLDQFEEVSLLLQNPNTNMYQVRAMFDLTIRDYPAMRRYLSSDAEIIKFPRFEKCIVQSQAPVHLKRNPTQEECTILSELQGEFAVEADFVGDADEIAQPRTYLQDSLRYAETLQTHRRQTEPVWKSTLHVVPTSNIVERAFSYAKMILTRHRVGMLPSNFEMIMILKFNRHLWNDMLIQECMNKEEAEAEETAAMMAEIHLDEVDEF